MAATSSQGVSGKQHLSLSLAGGCPEHLPDAFNLIMTILKN